VGELLHDAISLAELQAELFKIDCREGMRRALVPLVLLFSAAILALGSVPIVLIFVAEVLIEGGHFSRTAAFLIAAAMGLGIAGAVGWAGWSYSRRSARMFRRSAEELTRNLAWIKRVVARPAPTVSAASEEH
jgi:formate hydrogenlyase subunit 3/multisubunit Na+/H+ antiporter MnhD subunit